MNLARRGLVLAIGILLLGVITQWLPPDSLFEGAWRWLGAAWLLLLAFEGIMARSTRLGATLDPAVQLHLGRAASLQVRLRNLALRPLQIEAFWPVPTGARGEAVSARLLLGAGSETVLTLPLRPLCLGVLAPGTVQARCLGRCGLAWWSRGLPVSGEALRVVPDLQGLARARAGGLVLGESAAARRGAGLDLLGLRQYQAGDPLRAIAWKAAARSGQLLVRDFAEDQHLDVMLVLDIGRVGAQTFGELTRLHHAVNIAARLAERATAFGDRVGLIAYAGAVCVRVPLAGGMAGLRSVRVALTGLEVHNEESDPLAAVVAVRRECRVRALVAWFSDAENGAHGGALPQALRRLAPKHLPLIANLRDAQLEALARQAPRQWKDPYVALAAMQALEGAAESARTLRRLGCEVVEAPPERLDHALVRRYLELRGQRRV